MIKLPPSIISLALSVIVGLFAARWILPAAYIWRGYFAIGVEWVIILGMMLVSWLAGWKIISMNLKGGE